MISRADKMNFIKKYPFQIFLSLHFLLWSFLPLLRQSLPMDSIEAVVWGRLCDFGTNKHPPLSGWLAHFFYDIIGFEQPIAIYMLSQLCVLVGFIYIYRLAREFMSKERASMAVMLLSGVIYYGFSAIEYNVNVVSLCLWPMCAFHFYRAINENRLADWLLTGLFAGLNLFNKYTSGLMLLGMGVLMLYNKKARARLKSYQPYLCALVCFVVILPHLLWLFDHNFFSFSYFIGRGSKTDFANFPILKHIIYPLKFFGAQILFGLGAFLVYAIAGYHQKRFDVKANQFQKDFLYLMGLLPVVTMTLLSFVFGIKLKSMWGFPCYYLAGVMLFVFFPYKLTTAFKKRMYIGVYVMLFLLFSAQALVILFNKSDKFHLKATQYGQTLENIWYKKYGNFKFMYVAGDVWWADNAALFAPSQPKPLIWGDFKQNPWLDEHDINDKGALLIAGSLDEYQSMKNKLKFVSKPEPLDIYVTNRLGKIKKKPLYYGFYNVYGER